MNALRIGAYKINAAKAARISYDALQEWLEKGRAGDKQYAQFASDCDEAMATFGNRLQGTISKAAAAGDWKAAAWDLERRFPELYGRAAEPMLGMTIGGGGDGEDDDQPQKTRVVFYIPDNGRRPVEET